MSQYVNLNPEEPWSPNAIDPNADPVHIVEGMARPGEMAKALCGVTWRVARVHSATSGGSTCEGCQARLLARDVHRR